MKEELLRQSYERILAFRAEQGGDRSACPSIDGIQALIGQQGGEAERLARLDHVMGCPYCRREFELLRTVKSVTPTRTFSPRFVALAASVTLLLAVGLFWRLGPSKVDTPRGPAGTLVLLLPMEGDHVDGRPTFVWRPVAGALRYRLEVLRADGTAVSQRLSTDTSAVLADSIQLDPAGDYRWLVEADGADGTMQRSEMHRFTLRRP